MEGINRGTTLGGRYRVEEQLSGPDGTTRWSATDTTLGREVTVLAFPTSHPHAEETRDCALRLAGVEDPRLGKVLDVGADGDVSYVVLDAQHHGSSLARLLREDTVPPEEVRRIAGEAALALEAARQRGLHHGVLTPHDLLRQPTGGVVVFGVAVNASLAGQDDTGDDGTRTDVVALVRCVYAGLTGRWPGPGEIDGLPSVRRRADGHVPAPGELVTGVPSDLDTLCRTVLNDDEGPRNPGELARQISPWSSEPVQGTGGRPAGPDGIRLPSSPAAGSLPATSGDETVVAALPAGFGAAVAARSAGPDDATVIGRRAELDHDETTAYRPRTDASPYVEEELEPPLPLLDTGRDEPDRSSSRLALGIVAGITALALLLGLLGLKSLFGGRGDDSGETPAPGAPSSAGAASAGPSAGAAAGAPAAGTPGGAIQVVSATSYDPQGDGNEHNETARRAVDGDPATEWITHRYKVATYTRKGKQGSGLALDLGSSRQVHTVKVTVSGAPIGAAVYVGAQPRVSAAAKLGDLSGSDTQVVTSSQGRTGRYVLIWVDRLGRVSGGYRAQIAEVEVVS